LHETAVGVRDRKEQQAAEQEPEDAARDHARQPVVHQDEPADPIIEPKPKVKYSTVLRLPCRRSPRHQYFAKQHGPPSRGKTR
jgi:hypothetical protein